MNKRAAQYWRARPPSKQALHFDQVIACLLRAFCVPVQQMLAWPAVILGLEAAVRSALWGVPWALGHAWSAEKDVQEQLMCSTASGGQKGQPSLRTGNPISGPPPPIRNRATGAR
jgi:hypothetical protein